MLKCLRFAAVAITLACVVGLSAVSAQILNSERIEQTFGSYGIDVLFSDERYRLSNLYSEHDGFRVTRTLAVVEYPDVVDDAFAAQHEQILAGSSIGATLQAAGWEVIKSNVSFGAIAARDELALLMGIETGTELATHLYRLDIARDGERFFYSTIVEIHHPDYLSQQDLTSIYRLDYEPPGPEVRKDLSLLLQSQRLIGELNLTLGQ